MPYLHIHDGEEVVYEELCPVCVDDPEWFPLDKVAVVNLNLPAVGNG
jgi:hypothetical protein